MTGDGALLHHLLERSAARTPAAVAVEDPASGMSMTYAELDTAAEAVRSELARQGVVEGDRVGVAAPKSLGVVASIFGILKAGAAYVPVDYSAPPARNAYIFQDCGVRAVVGARDRIDSLRRQAADIFSPSVDLPLLRDYVSDLVLVGGVTAGVVSEASEPVAGIAYILYTSGSTGQPKGVVHTHGSGLSFVEWLSDLIEPDAEARFSSHAPFHFDLSILDLYVPIKHGATLVLINEDLGKQPQLLAEVISGRRISVWYSTPSILRLLADYGRMHLHDYDALRTVFFAGYVRRTEIFETGLIEVPVEGRDIARAFTRR